MANSDIIKIGFDYRASLEQFKKETNGVFEGISDKAGKQKITIQLDAKDDKVIDKIKELQKLKLDKFTFEFGNSGLKEQLQTFDKLENKINDIISLSKGIDLSFNTKNKTEAYNQLKKYADAFKDYYGNEEAMATNAGAKVGYAYYKAYEEALRKGVAQSKLEKVTVDFDVNDSIFSKERIVENRIKEFENFQKYGNADESNLIAEITLLENRLLKFNSAYSQVKANLGDAPITPEITKNIEEYVRMLEVAESRAKDAELFGYSSEDINSDKDLANMYLDFAKEDATAENKKYIESLKQEETQAIATTEAEQKLAEVQKETVSNTSNSNNSQIEELKSDIQEVKTELGDVKDRISSIESNGFENVRDDVEKTKESVKELNSELTEMKSNLSSTSQESNISSASGVKDSEPSIETKVWDKNVQAIQDYMDAVTKLNNLKAEDKGSGKEASLIELQTKNVEELKQAAYEAKQSLTSMVNPHDADISTWEKWLEVMKQFDQASLGSAESIAKLEDALRNANEAQNKYISAVVNKQNNYLNDYETASSKKGFVSSDIFKEKIVNYKVEVSKLTDLAKQLSHQDFITKEQQNQFENLKQNCENARKELTKMSASEKGANQVGIDKLIQRINKDLDENTNFSKQAKLGLKALREELESANPRNLKEITSEIINIENAEIRAGRAGKDFIDILKNSGIHKFAADLVGMFGVYDVINGFKQGISIVRELNTALTEMRKVSNETILSLKNYQATTFDTADAVGTTAKQIQNSTADWMRLGESMEQAAESAKDANVLLNVSEFKGIDEATESLVSMSQAYKDLDKMDIINVLNNIGNNYSISTDGLATALKDSASALVTANNDLNEAVALTTAGNAITQNPASVGAGLRTISLRLVGTEAAKQELADLGEETDDMITTVSKLEDTIMNATKAASADGKGFDILDDNGNYKSTYEIMQGLSDLYDDIVKKDKELGTNNLNLLLETIAGKNRSNIAASILQNGDMLRSVFEDAQNSEGSALNELNSYLDSVDGKLQQLTNRTQEFWFKLIDSETIKNGIDLLSSLTKGVTDFVDTVGVLPTLLTGIGTALSFNDLGWQTKMTLWCDAQYIPRAEVRILG